MNKPMYASLTFWGCIIVIVGAFLTRADIVAVGVGLAGIGYRRAME